jgi:hypothetical protein
MIRWNGRILTATASTLLVLSSSCAPADAPEGDADADAAMTGDAAMGTDATGGEAMAADADALIDPNEAEPVALTGAGLDQAQVDAIVAARPFADMTELDALLAGSMDTVAREDLYEQVWIPIDLNAATREEILLIPGVGERMAHEFEEYRPYDAIERFRREIGKYVDEEEVARLEPYVTIR